MVMGGVVVRGVIAAGTVSHHRIRMHPFAGPFLETVGALTQRCRGCQQPLAAHQGHLIGGEPKRHLEVVFHHLIVVKLEIGTNQIAALDAHQQEALA